MAKLSITSNLVLSIANKDSKKFVKSVNEKVNNLMAQAIESLSTQVSYISLDNTILQPVNELFNDSMVDNSQFIYVLGIDSAQLDLNTVKKSRFWDSLKTRAKIAWQNRKIFKKRRRKKRKKQQQEEQIFDVKFDPSKYTVYKLTEDMQKSICNYLSPSSIVYQGNNKLEIVGKEDFGPNVKIVVYLVSLVEKQFKFYCGKRKNSFINLCIKERYSKVRAKRRAVGVNYTKALKVFNALYFNINGIMPNQLYVESLLDFVPDNLFEGKDFYQVFLKILNYLSIKSLRKIPSILDETKTVNEDKRCGDCGIGFNKILSSISTEDLIDEES